MFFGFEMKWASYVDEHELYAIMTCNRYVEEVTIVVKVGITYYRQRHQTWHFNEDSLAIGYIARGYRRRYKGIQETWLHNVRLVSGQEPKMRDNNTTTNRSDVRQCNDCTLEVSPIYLKWFLDCVKASMRLDMQVCWYETKRKYKNVHEVERKENYSDFKKWVNATTVVP